MKELLVYYCRYNVWANEKLAQFFVDKEEALMGQFIESSFPSIRKTLLHLLSAERSWLARLQQNPSLNARVVDDFVSTAAMLEALTEVSKNFSAFVENQDDNYFESIINYQTWDGTQWEMQPKTMIHHCMNHSTYHRGQIVTLARQLGMKEGVPSTDLLYYSRSLT